MRTEAGLQKKKKKRRTAVRIMTKEARVLKFMRESAGFSMRQAAEKLGTSCARVSHSENGRRDLDTEFIFQCVNVYGFSYGEFCDYLSGKKEVPQHILSECIGILKRLAPEKLRTAKAILETM